MGRRANHSTHSPPLALGAGEDTVGINWRCLGFSRLHSKIVFLVIWRTGGIRLETMKSWQSVSDAYCWDVADNHALRFERDLSHEAVTVVVMPSPSGRGNPSTTRDSYICRQSWPIGLQPSGSSAGEVRWHKVRAHKRRVNPGSGRVQQRRSVPSPPVIERPRNCTPGNPRPPSYGTPGNRAVLRAVAVWVAVSSFWRCTVDGRDGDRTTNNNQEHRRKASVSYTQAAHEIHHEALNKRRNYTASKSCPTRHGPPGGKIQPRN